MSPIAAITNNSGAYLRTFFTASTTCAINFDTSGNATPPQIWWRVDGSLGTWTQAAASSSVACAIPAATSGAANVTYHAIEVVIADTYPGSGVNRWSTPLAGGATFKGLTLDNGASLATPQSYPKRGLFIGDSICEGLWTMNQTATSSIDGRASWATLVGTALNSEFGMACFAGNGFLSSSAGVPAVGSAYNLLYQGVSRSFSPAPDYIIVEEGTNDGSNSTTSAATALLNGLESAAPSAQIFVLRPFNGTAQSDYLTAACAGSITPGKCHFIDTAGIFNTVYGADTSGALHPTGPNDLAMIAPQVSTAVAAILYASGGSGAVSIGGTGGIHVP